MKYFIPTILIVAFVGFVAYATINTLPTDNPVASDKEASTLLNTNINSNDIPTSTITNDPLPQNNVTIENPTPSPTKTPTKKIRYEENEEDD